MTVALDGLLAVLGLTVLVMLLEPLTRRTSDRVRAWETGAAERKREAGLPEPAALAGPQGETPTATPIAAEDTVGNHFRRVVSHQAVVGAFLIPVMFAFFPANALILAEGLEVLLDRSGTVLTTVAVGQWSWNVTDLELYGGIVALAMVLLGAAFSTLRRERSRAAWALFATALVPLLNFEVGLAALRGTIVANGSDVSPLVMGVASGLQGLVCANAELWSGHFAVSCFLVPLAQLCASIVASPFRFLAKRFGRVRLRKAKKVAPVADPNRPGLLVRFLACVDEGVIAPLRQVDAATSAWIARVRSRRAQAQSRAHGMPEVSDVR